MAKDPTAYLRTESRRSWTPSADDQRTRTTKAAIAYMMERGAFDEWKDERGVQFVPMIDGLPWNPEAPKRIIGFRVTIPVEGHWKDGQSRVRSPRGKHWLKGTWINAHQAEVARVPVPHWDYDGCDSTAREAWELNETNRTMDHAARYRREDADHSYEIEQEAANFEAGEEENWEWCDPRVLRQAFIDRYATLADRPALRPARRRAPMLARAA